MPIIDAKQFQSHMNETERLLDNFWEQYRQLTLEAMLKVQDNRFTGAIIPELKDIVAVPDKINRVHGISIGEIIEILPSHDNEARVCKVRLARKSTRTHPYPLNQSTCKPRIFTRGTDKLIFLLLRKPQEEKDENPHSHFLYDELVGKPYLNQEAMEGEDDTNREDKTNKVDENYEEVQENANVNEDDEDTQGDETRNEIQKESGENATVKLIFHGDEEVQDEIVDIPGIVKKRGRPKKM